MPTPTGRNSDVTQRLHDLPVTGLNASDQIAIGADTIYYQGALTDSEKDHQGGTGSNLATARNRRF